MSRFALSVAAVPSLIAALGCSQASAPPDIRTAVVTDAPAPAPPPVAEVVVVDYWLVAARGADRQRIAPEVDVVAPAVLHELGDAPVELELFDRVTLRTRTDRVARIEGARAKVSQGPGGIEVELAGGTGKLDVPLDALPSDLTVLGRTLAWPPFGGPFFERDKERRGAPVTVFVLARTRTG